MPRIPGARVHHQPGGLVDYQNVRVLVDQPQCDVLALYFRLGRLIHRHLHLPAGPPLDHVPRFAGIPAHLDRTGLDPTLDSSARVLWQKARKRAVKPLAGHFRGNSQIDLLELWRHGALEASGGASGILPRFRKPLHCKESLVRLRDLVRSSRVLLIAVALGVVVAGCRSHRADDAKSGPEVIYARAQKAMKNSSYAEAIKQLEALQSRFPFSEPARQSQLDLIWAYYKARQTDPAIDAADTFIRENPTNPRVDYAYYMKGLVYFERQANWLERKFNVDLSQRPPINATKSFEAFKQLIEKYPNSKYVSDSRQRMVFLRNRLADFELHVALYYMRRGAYVGAINRAKYCIENYDGAPAVKGSLKVLVDAYRDLKMMDLAANAQRVYADNYPANAKDVAVKKHWWPFF